LINCTLQYPLVNFGFLSDQAKLMGGKKKFGAAFSAGGERCICERDLRRVLPQLIGLDSSTGRPRKPPELGSYQEIGGRERESVSGKRVATQKTGTKSVIKGYQIMQRSFLMIRCR
jgi:hypothetical protein